MIRFLFIYLIVLGLLNLPAGLMFFVLAYGVKHRKAIARKFTMFFCYSAGAFSLLFAVNSSFPLQDVQIFPFYAWDIEMKGWQVMLLMLVTSIVFLIPAILLSMQNMKDLFHESRTISSSEPPTSVRTG